MEIFRHGPSAIKPRVIKGAGTSTFGDPVFQDSKTRKMVDKTVGIHTHLAVLANENILKFGYKNHGQVGDALGISLSRWFQKA